MSLRISRPSGVNIGVNNPNSISYLSGNEFTDGSIRVVPDLNNKNAEFQHRTNGVWIDTGIQIAASSINLARALLISAAGEWVSTFEAELGITSLIPHSIYNSINGTVGNPRTPFLSPLVIRSVRRADETSEVAGNDLQVLHTHAISATRQLWKKIYFKTGSVGATAPVTMTLRRETSNGLVIWQRNLPTSLFSTPNTEISFEIDGFMQLNPGNTTHIQLLSDDPLSLKSDSSGEWFLAVDKYDLNDEELLTENLVLSNDLSMVFSNNLNLVRGNYKF